MFSEVDLSHRMTQRTASATGCPPVAGDCYVDQEGVRRCIQGFYSTKLQWKAVDKKVKNRFPDDRYYSDDPAGPFLNVETNAADNSKYSFTLLGKRVEEKLYKLYMLDDTYRRKLRTALEKRVEGVDTFSIMKALHLDGYDIWLVGGAVRSVLLGDQKEEEIKDLDIAGTAPISVVMEKVNQIGGMKLLSSPKSDRSVLFVDAMKLPDQKKKPMRLFEYAPLKLRYHKINDANDTWLYDNDMKADSYCRDLTINAIFYNPFSGCLFDPTGYGLSDIKPLTIRLAADLTQNYPDKGKVSILFRLMKFVDRYKDANLEINDFKKYHLEECYNKYMELEEIDQARLFSYFRELHENERRPRFVVACKKIGIDDFKINELSKHI